jgi:hypothetical protein
MQKRGVIEEIKKVKICGDFCEWDGYKAVELTKSGNVWIL